MRARGRQVPDGNDHAAALSDDQRQNPKKSKLGLRRCGRGGARRPGGGASAVVPGRAPGVTGAAAAAGGGGGCTTGIGLVVVVATGSVPGGATPRRGQAKASEGPAGDGMGSPRTITLVAGVSTWRGGGPPPSNVLSVPCVGVVNGTAAPESGRATGEPGRAADGAGVSSGVGVAGIAIGAARVVSTRRISRST